MGASRGVEWGSTWQCGEGAWSSIEVSVGLAWRDRKCASGGLDKSCRGSMG